MLLIIDILYLSLAKIMLACVLGVCSDGKAYGDRDLK